MSGLPHRMRELDLSGIRSSYRENKYGKVFYALTTVCKPSLAVELGTFMGYSALHIAAAMAENDQLQSELHLIDLWERYPYRHCSVELAIENFRKNDLLDRPSFSVQFINGDALEQSQNYGDDSIDLLHIDISNDGRSLDRCVKNWHRKLKVDGLLLFEGGSEERDRFDWMVKFNKVPINVFKGSPWFREHYEALTLLPFPSLTVARRIK